MRSIVDGHGPFLRRFGEQGADAWMAGLGRCLLARGDAAAALPILWRLTAERDYQFAGVDLARALEQLGAREAAMRVLAPEAIGHPR